MCAALLLVMGLLGSPASAHVSTAPAPAGPDSVDCAAPTFVGVRGSGEQPQSPDLAQYRAGRGPSDAVVDPAVRSRGLGTTLDRLAATVTADVAGESGVTVLAVTYPAIPVVASVPYAVADYRDSVAIGATNLARVVASLVDRCGERTRIVLAGYSQGANVINRYLVDHVQDSRAMRSLESVVLLGDPNTRPGRPGERLEGTAVGATGSVAFGAIAGDADSAPFLAAYPSVVSSFCLAGDTVCNPGVCRAGIVGCDPVADIERGDAIHVSYSSPETRIPCPAAGGAELSVLSCAGLRVTSDLGYPRPASAR